MVFYCCSIDGGIHCFGPVGPTALRPSSQTPSTPSPHVAGSFRYSMQSSPWWMQMQWRKRKKTKSLSLGKMTTRTRAAAVALPVETLVVEAGVVVHIAEVDPTRHGRGRFPETLLLLLGA